MSPFYPFEMERMMSLFEQEVDYNLSESGVHPIRLGELLGDDPTRLEQLLATIQRWPGVHGTLTSIVLSTYKETRELKVTPMVLFPQGGKR